MQQKSSPRQADSPTLPWWLRRTLERQAIRLSSTSTARQRHALWCDHGPAQLGGEQPCGVGTQAELLLELQRRDPGVAIR